MKTVRLPNGSTIGFPDTMDEAQITAAVRKHLGWQPAEPAQQPPAPAPDVGRPPFGLPAVPDLMELTQRIPDPFASDLVSQPVATGAGAAIGTGLAGPVGGAIGGAAGNVFGRIGSRLLRDEELPTGREMAVDAAVGAAGPAAGALAKAGLKRFVGLNDDRILQRGMEAAEKAARKFNPNWTWADLFRHFDQAATSTIRQSLLNALRVPPSGALTQRGGEMLALGHMLLNGDPVKSLGVLLGGYTLSGLHRATAKRLLKSDRFIRWITAAPKSRMSRTDLLAGLSALTAEKALSGDLDHLIEAVQGGSKGSRPRDARGRFLPGELTDAERDVLTTLQRSNR